MVEHTREHPRLAQENPAGVRLPLATGNLFIPEKLAHERQLPLIVHFLMEHDGCRKSRGGA